MEEIQGNFEEEQKKNSLLESEVEALNDNIAAANMGGQQQSTLIDQLKAQIEELEAELQNSVDQREDLKADLNDANEKVIGIEEELYESKSHQLNLLDSLNKTNEKFEQYIIENENKAEEVEQELKKKLMFAQEKIQELHDVCQKMEYTQVIYIAHKTDKIDQALAHFINKHPERQKMNIAFLRESEGVYQFGSKRVYVKVEKGDKIFVRVGGGFMYIEDFIRTYTTEETDKIQRKDAFAKFRNKLQI